MFIDQNATSICQSFEWGMRLMQAKFLLICYGKIQFKLNGDRKIILTLMIYLYNCFADKTGINTILIHISQHFLKTKILVARLY